MQGATTPPMNSRCCDGFVGNTNDWVDFEIEGAKVLRKYDLTYLFFEPADEPARPWQSYVKVVDPEEQEEAVARRGVVGTCQRGMLVGAPLVETE